MSRRFGLYHTHKLQVFWQVLFFYTATKNTPSATATTYKPAHVYALELPPPL